MARYTLSKQQRLSGKKNIETLFQSGEAFFIHPYRVTYKLVPLENNTPPARIAIVAPKRNFKRAVDRNKIKRKVREAYRLQQHQLNQDVLIQQQKSLHFIVMFVAKTILEYTEIYSQMGKLIEKLNKTFLVNSE